MAHYPVGFLPGTTDRSTVRTPIDRWNKRIKSALSLMRNPDTARAFAPFLRDADALLEAKMAQVAHATGGECGPIESMGLRAAALQTAYATYWMNQAAEDPSNTQLVMLASKLLDAARANDNAAYEMAVRIARSKPQTSTDPLADYTAAAE